jgi:hypothetical protein
MRSFLCFAPIAAGKRSRDPGWGEASDDRSFMRRLRGKLSVKVDEMRKQAADVAKAAVKDEIQGISGTKIK